jgi:glycosyltransferase involved in cell wall biosynthesis
MMKSSSPPRLLFVLPIVPWPIRRNGISLRFGPIVDYLSRRYELDLLVLAEGAETSSREGPLQLCRSVTVIRVPIVSLPPFARRIKIAWSGLAPWGLPLGASRHFAQHELEQEVVEYLKDTSYSAVVWAAGHLGVASRIRRRYPEVRFVIDLVDSPSLAIARGGLPGRILNVFSRYTAWKWRRLERRVQDIFDSAIYISSVDARSARPIPTSRTHVVPNGITFSDVPDSFRKAARGSPIIGFLGDMSYRPNVSAVLRLAHRIFPRICASFSEARLLIIGRNPVPAIRSLQSDTITVTGTVDNIWSYISEASVFVFPMTEGVGLQNKILEAMYAEVPVVTTPLAAGGLGTNSNNVLSVGDSDDDIADRTVRILRDAAQADEVARRAKQFVLREFDWETILPRYEAIVLKPGQG